jgi:hypothetical protein
MKLRTLILAGAFALGACESKPTIKFDADPSADFAAYHSYSWAYSQAPRGMNPLLYQRVRDSIDRALAARGFTQSALGEFAVGFTLGKRDRVEVTDFGAYGGYYRGWGGWGWGGYHGYNHYDVRNVTDGTLMIDIYDTATKKPVWNGTATQEISSDGASQATIDAAVVAVLGNFPPPPPKAKK